MLTWLAALERRSFRLSLLTGVLLFLGLQLTLAFLVVAAMAAAATPLHALAARRSGERPVRLHEAASLAGGALLGVLAPALGLQLWSGYDSLEVWYLCYAKHAGFSGQFGRTYWPWFLMNPVEMFVFMGAPVSALTAWAACRDMPNLWRPGTRPETLLWAFVLIMALLHVSGKNLGEVARLWMFVMPLAAAVAGCALSRLDRRHGLAAAACVAVLYVQTVVFRVSLETLALP
jgi:hypothetical protein